MNISPHPKLSNFLRSWKLQTKAFHYKFLNRLQKAASLCKFSPLADELIRDRIVIRLQVKNTKQRILEEKILDLDKALNICRPR